MHHHRVDERRPGPHQEPGDEGRRGHVRPARRVHPAGVRPDPRQPDPPHPRAPRAGRRPHGRGLRPRHRPPRRGHGHQRPGGHQHRHAAVRRLHGLDPDGRHHRAGAHRRHRHRRLPGVRHHRHHPVGHQAQRAGHRSAQDIPRAVREAFHIATTGRPGPVLVDIPKDIVDPKNPNSAMDWYWPTDDEIRDGLPGYTPDDARATPARSARRPS